MKRLFDFCVILVFCLAMTYEFALALDTGRITGETLFPIAMLFFYWLVGICTEKPKKAPARKPIAQRISVEMRGSGWERGGF